VRPLHQAGRSLRQIATLLGASKSTVAGDVERLGLQRVV
jgi:IS30 family transposase